MLETILLKELEIATAELEAAIELAEVLEEPDVFEEPDILEEPDVLKEPDVLAGTAVVLDEPELVLDKVVSLVVEAVVL